MNVTETSILKDRHIGRRYLIEDVTLTDDFHGDLHPALEVAVYHYPQGKCWVESVTRVTVSPTAVQWVATIGRDEERPVMPGYLQIPVARYSQKALEARTADFLARVEYNMPALLDWASRAPKF